MSEFKFSEDELANATREEIMSALFANMVIQQTNMALMMLGKVPHPETGETIHDLESAKMFIDQLEMMEFKTKGNLNAQEQKLLMQGLGALRMAFVEAIEGQVSDDPVASVTEAPSAAIENPPPAASAPASSQAEDDSRKKFTKKY